MEYDFIQCVCGYKFEYKRRRKAWCPRCGWSRIVWDDDKPRRIVKSDYYSIGRREFAPANDSGVRGSGTYIN